MPGFREEFLSRFRWIDGHADVVGLLADSGFLRSAVQCLADPFRNQKITKIAAVEARGFALGAAVAIELQAGFVGIRKAGSIHPGPKVVRTTEADWRGRRHELRLQRAALAADDVVLLIDDWAETGSQAQAAKQVILECGARYAGLSLLVDELTDEIRTALAPVRAVVMASELPSR